MNLMLNGPFGLAQEVFSLYNSIVLLERQIWHEVHFQKLVLTENLSLPTIYIPAYNVNITLVTI